MSLRTRNKVSAIFSMSSLTDVVFLLLIFLMLTSTLVSPNALKLLLPNSSSQTLATQNISVSINKDLEYFVGTRRVRLGELSRILAQSLDNKADPTVVLNAERSVPIEEVVKVMDIANKMKVKMILATSNKP